MEDARPSIIARAAEIKLIVLLALFPLVYFPGLTYVHTHLKQPLALLIALLVVVLAALRADSLRRWCTSRLPVLVPAFIMLALVFASSAWHRFHWAAPEMWLRDSVLFAAFIGFAVILSDQRSRRLFARWLPVAWLPAALIIGLHMASGRITYFGNRNLAGGFLVLPVTACAVYLMAKFKTMSPGKRAMLATGVALGVWAMWLTASRGALAGTAVGIYAAAFVLAKGARRDLLLGGLALGVCAAALWIVRPDIVQEFFGIRWHIWRATVSMIESAPILGQGAGGFAGAVRAFQPIEYFAHPNAAPATIHAHCYPLEIMAELGIPGLVAYASLLAGLALLAARAIKSADPANRPIIIGVAAGLLAMVVHGMVSIAPSYIDVQMNFWLGAAFIAGSAAPAELRNEISARRIAPAAIVAAGCLALLCLVSIPAFRAQYLLAKSARVESNLRIEMLHEALNVQPFEDAASIAARLKLADEYKAVGRLDVSLALLNDMDALAPNFKGIATDIAMLHLMRDDHDAAAAHAARAAESNPFDLLAFQIWLQSLYRGADAPTAQHAAELLDSALHTGQRYQRIDPLSAYLQGRFLMHPGDDERAKSALERASSLCEEQIAGLLQKHGPLQTLSGFSLWQEVADTAKDIAMYDRMAEAMTVVIAYAKRYAPEQNLPHMHYLHALFHQRAGNIGEARQLAEQIVAECLSLHEAGMEWTPRVLELLVKSYEIFDIESARKYALKLQELAPSNAVARDLLD